MKDKQLRMQSIKYPKINLEQFGYSKTNQKCPLCSKKLAFGRVPCPQAIPGCLDMHYAYRCFDCSEDFQEATD